METITKSGGSPGATELATSAPGQAAGTGLEAENPLIPELVALYRRASPEAKLDAIGRLNGMLIGMREAHLRARHPDWSPERRRAELRRWWFGAGD